MSNLQPHEVRLEGGWAAVGGKVLADSITERINELLTSGLTRLADAEGGWEILYLDEHDGRMWELTYPHSEWHGGGPPRLTHVSVDYAKSKYKIG